MYATVRCYRLDEGDMDEAMHRVDAEFADRLAREPGFVAYECIRTGDDGLCTVTICREEAATERSNELAAEFVRDSLSDMKFTRTDMMGGEVQVSRAEREVLEPAHH